MAATASSMTRPRARSNSGNRLPGAYSDDVAQSFRLDVAYRSDLMSPSVPG